MGQAVTSDRRQIGDTRKCDGGWMEDHADDGPRHSIDLCRNRKYLILLVSAVGIEPTTL